MDGTVPPPGTFAADFATASQPAAPPPQRGGPFGGIAAAMGAAGAAMASMRNGIAQRHYVAGNFVRTDDVANQKATIVDCGARTVTTLDLAAKTYRVVSLDAPVAPGGAPGQRPGPPGPAPVDDGSKIDIKMTSAALGPKTIDSVATNGYQVEMLTTVTKPTGEAQSMDVATTSYFSGYGQPAEGCARGFAAAAPPMMPNAGALQSMMSAMSSPSGDPRVTVSASGPPLPAGKLPLYLAMQPKANGRGGFAMLLENGDVREVSDGDKTIFGVPADFMKLP